MLQQETLMPSSGHKELNQATNVIRRPPRCEAGSTGSRQPTDPLAEGRSAWRFEGTSPRQPPHELGRQNVVRQRECSWV